MDIVELKKFFLFQSMSGEEISEFSSYCTSHDYFDGLYVFHEKDRGETMHIVMKGAVKIVRDGGEVIANLGPGDFFGEVALFDYALRTAGAVADGDTTLLEIHRNEFNKAFKNNPRIVAKLLYQLMTEMSRRLRVKNNPGGGLIF
jgi:CRP-like cAMP-binding protein